MKDYIDEHVNRFPNVDPVFYEQSFLTLVDFCSLIDKQEKQELEEKTDNPISSLMKNYVIIRLVSLIEYHLKALISELIDNLNINPKRILESESISIELNVLLNFKSKQYTRGKIIIAHLDKMNANQIKKILSRINRLDYFGWYSSLMRTFSSDVPKKAFYDQYVFELYKHRNDIIHNMTDVEYTAKDLEGMIKFFQQFGLQLVTFTCLNIGIFEKNWTDEEALAYCDDLTVPSKEKFLDDFKKVTDRFRNKYLEKHGKN